MAFLSLNSASTKRLLSPSFIDQGWGQLTSHQPVLWWEGAGTMKLQHFTPTVGAQPPKTPPPYTPSLPLPYSEAVN